MTTHPVFFYGTLPGTKDEDFPNVIHECNRILRSTTKRLEFGCWRPAGRWPEQRDISPDGHIDGWPIHVKVQPDAYYAGECPEGSRVVAPLEPIKLLHEIGHCWGLGWAEVYKCFGQMDNTGTKPQLNCSRNAKSPCGCIRRNRHWFHTVMCGNGARFLEYEKRILAAECQWGDERTTVSPNEWLTVLITDKNKERVDGAHVQVWRWVQYRQKPQLQYTIETSKKGAVVFEWGGNETEVQTDAMRIIRVEHEGRVVKDWIHVMECVESRWLLRKWQVEVTV